MAFKFCALYVSMACGVSDSIYFSRCDNKNWNNASFSKESLGAWWTTQMYCVVQPFALYIMSIYNPIFCFWISIQHFTCLACNWRKRQRNHKAWDAILSPPILRAFQIIYFSRNNESECLARLELCFTLLVYPRYGALNSQKWGYSPLWL